jgi:thymidine kinase
MKTDYYFVGHSFTRQRIDDFRNVVERSINIDSVQPYYADSDVQQKHILEKTFEKISGCKFAIFDISELRSNVLLELGIAIGLNRPIIVSSLASVILPDVINSMRHINYSSMSELSNKLKKIDYGFISGHSQTNEYNIYCNSCGKICSPRIRTYRAREACLLGKEPDREVDLWEALTRVLNPLGFHIAPKNVILQGGENTKLCELFNRVVSSRFVIFSLTDNIDDTSCIALGIAIGTNTPWINICEKGVFIPSLLEGIDRFEYFSLLNLQDKLPERMMHFLGRSEIKMPEVSELPSPDNSKELILPKNAQNHTEKMKAGLYGGSIELIVGSMFAGKTSELIRRIKRAQNARQDVKIFTPLLRQRYPSGNVILSHDGESMDAITVPRAIDILTFIENKTTVVAIDEAQEFDWSLPGVCNYLSRNGLRVIVSGLDLDFRGIVYGPMAQLMGEAERIDKLQAICLVCGEAASRTQRFLGNHPADFYTSTEIQSDESYECRCRRHHQVPNHPGLWET